MDAIIRTYEHRQVKVTVFASHRSPSCASGFPTAPPPAPADDLKAPPLSPTRPNRASTAPLRAFPLVVGGHAHLSLESYGERSSPPSQAGDDTENGMGMWSTHALALRRHRASLLSSCDTHQSASPVPEALGHEGEGPLAKRRRTA